MVMVRGYSQEEVQSILEDVEHTTLIDEQTRAILQFGKQLTLDPHTVTSSDIDALRARGLSDADVLETVWVIAAFNLWDRIADGLGVESHHLQDKVAGREQTDA